MSFTLPGRVVLLTGAAGGIGRTASLAFWRAGARVAAVDLQAERLEALAEEAVREGFEVEAIVADVSRPEDVERSVAETLRRWGRLDVLVSNAGFVHRAPVVEMTDDEWDRTMAVDLTPAFLYARQVIPAMKAQGSGRIICTSSHHALQGREASAHFSAAKAGLNSLVKSLARELGPYSITANAVAPGPVLQVDEHRPSARLREHEQTLPLRRLGQPEDVAGLMLYLASDAAAWVTGQVILVNGGGLMP